MAWQELARWTQLPPQIPAILNHCAGAIGRARAVGEIGRREESMQLLRELATERDYYGFLVADRAGLEYQFREAPIAATRAELDVLGARAGLIRSREFERVSLPQHAAREWNFEMKQLTPRQLEVAAVLASQWGRPERAIFALGMANAYDDSSRFDFPCSTPNSRANTPHAAISMWRG